MSYFVWSLQVHKIEEIAEVAAMDVGEEIPTIPIPEKQKWLNEHPYVPISTLWATWPMLSAHFLMAFSPVKTLIPLKDAPQMSISQENINCWYGVISFE